MKKLSIILMACLINSSVFSQAEFGFKGGLNIANLKSSVDGVNFSGDDLVAFHLGLFADNYVSDNLSLQVEAVFSKQGTSIDDPVFGQSNTELYYLNLPILLKYKATDILGIYAGPQIGFLLATNEVDGQDFKDQLAPIDLSLAIGLEFHASENVRIGGRYNFGVSNIVDNEEADLFDVKTVNRVGQIYLGFVF